jgi:hypothetical protein
MGIMFIIHEYGRPGSIYQAVEREEEENGDGTHEIVYREISIWEHVMTSLYNSFSVCYREDMKNRSLLTAASFICLERHSLS